MHAAGHTAGTITRPWFVVTPEDLASSGWDVFLSAAMIYAAIVTPLEVGVMRYEDRNGGELHTLPLAMNLSAWVVYSIFVVDTALQFVLAYFEDTVRMWVFEPKYIMERYLKSHFLVDLLSILPWRIICAFLGARSGLNPLGGRVRRYARALRILELLRACRAPRLIARLRVHSGESSGGGARTCGMWGARPAAVFSWILTNGIGKMRHSSLTLLKFVIISLLSLHWVACIWALLPALQRDRDGWTARSRGTLAGSGARPLALYVQSFESPPRPRRPSFPPAPPRGSARAGTRSRRSSWTRRGASRRTRSSRPSGPSSRSSWAPCASFVVAAPRGAARALLGTRTSSG